MSLNVPIKTHNLPIWVTVAPQLVVNRTTPKMDVNDEHTILNEDTFQAILDSTFKEIRKELQTVLLFLIFVGSVIINSLVFILFYKKPTLRTFSNRFVLNLSLTHLLQAVMVMPYILVSGAFGEWPFGSVWCQISGVLFFCFSMETVFSLVLITADRNCAVNSPLHYSITITKRKTGVFIAGTWFLAFVMCLPPLFGVSRIQYRESWFACAPVWNPSDVCTIAYSTLLLVAGFVVPLVKLNWSYCSMFLAAKSSSARTRRHVVGASLTEVQLTSCQKTYILKRKPYHRSSSFFSQLSIFGNEWKAIKTGLLVVFSFIFCWLPLFLVVGIEPFMETSSWISDYFSSIVILFPLSASIINPYLYVFRNRTTLAYAKQFFRCGNTNKDIQTSKTRLISHHVLRSIDKPNTFCSTWQDNSSVSTLPTTLLQKNCQVEGYTYRSENKAHPTLNIQDNPSDKPLSTIPQILQQRPLLNNYYLFSPPSPEHVLVLHLQQRAHRDPSFIETIELRGASVNNMVDNLSILGRHKYLRRSTCAGIITSDVIEMEQPTRPIIARARSLEQDENETQTVSCYTSRFNGQRRKSLPLRRSFYHISSESTLTSSLSTDSQDSSTPVLIPKNRERIQLIRQHSITKTYPNTDQDATNMSIDNNSNALYFNYNE